MRHGLVQVLLSLEVVPPDRPVVILAGAFLALSLGFPGFRCLLIFRDVWLHDCLIYDDENLWGC